MAVPEENISDNTDLSPFFLITNWDEAVGPKIVEQFPSHETVETFLPGYNPLSFSTQIFMVASSLFGTQEYKKEVVDLPIVSFESRIRVRVVFDYKEVPQEEVRGGRLPYMLIIGYPQTKHHKKSLDQLQSNLVTLLRNFIENKEKSYINEIKQYRKQLLDALFTAFDTIDEFFGNLQHFSNQIVFGLITGTIIRQNIPELGFEKYLKQFSIDAIKAHKIGQVYIEEYHEYWYCFWSGPFVFFLRPQLDHLEDLSRFIPNLKKYTDHLWSLTLGDPHATLFNLFSNIEINPAITGDLFKLSHMSITRKLSGVSDLGFESQFMQNPEILYYLKDQARECYDLHFNDDINTIDSLMVSYLTDLKNIYSEDHWAGIFSVISYFFGELFNKKKEATNLSWIRTLTLLYEKFPLVQVQQKHRSLFVSHCPFVELDTKLGFFTFIRSFLLAQYPKSKFKILLLENNEYKIETR